MMMMMMIDDDYTVDQPEKNAAGKLV